MDKRSVSPVIATVLLIAITVVIIGVVAVFARGLRLPPAPISVSIQLEGDGIGSTSFLIKHLEGDLIRDAFGSGLKDMDVRINGASVKGKVLLSLNGEGVTKSDFDVGDLLWVIGPELKYGDRISVIYLPTKQTLLHKEVTTTQAKTLPPSCKLELRLEEGEGDTAHDTSGNGINAKIYGATWTDGKLGKALSFEGKENYVQASFPSTTVGGADYEITMEAWAKIEKVTIPADYTWDYANAGVITHDNSSRYWLGIRYYGDNGSPADYARPLMIWYDNYYVIVKDLSFGTFYHFVGTWKNKADDTVDCNFYLNGELIDSFKLDNGKTTITATMYVMGKNNAERAVYYKGIIDEVRVYSRCIAPA